MTVVLSQTDCITRMLAEAVLPVPPLLEVTFPVEWLKFPMIFTLTLKLTVHEFPGGSVPPEKVTEVAVWLNVPLHWLSDGVLTQVIPLENVSENPMSYKVIELLSFLMVNDNVVGEFNNTGFGENHIFVKRGGRMAPTDSVAEALLPSPPLVELTVSLVFA